MGEQRSFFPDLHIRACDVALVCGFSFVYTFFKSNLFVRTAFLSTGVSDMSAYYVYGGSFLAICVLILVARLDLRGLPSWLTIGSHIGGFVGVVLVGIVSSMLLRGEQAVTMLNIIAAPLIAQYVVLVTLYWALALSNNTLANALRLSTIAFAISSGLSMLCTLPSQNVMSGILALAPLFGLWTYRAYEKAQRVEIPFGHETHGAPSVASRGSAELDRKEPALAKLGDAPSLSICILLIVFCVVGNALYSLSGDLLQTMPIDAIAVNLATIVLGMAALAYWKGGFTYAKFIRSCMLCIVVFFFGLCALVIEGGTVLRMVGIDVTLVARACLTLLAFVAVCRMSNLYPREKIVVLVLLGFVPQAIPLLIQGLLLYLNVKTASVVFYIALAAIFILLVYMCVFLSRSIEGVREAQAGGAVASSSVETTAMVEGAQSAEQPPLRGTRMRDELMAYGLTVREIDVAECFIRGYTLKKTADKLVLSQNTIKSHARSIYAKLGVNSKQELIDSFEKLLR